MVIPSFRLRELIIPIALVSIVGSVILPLPTMLLDFLLVGNLVLSVGLLVTALQIVEPIKLSALPTILLLCTLYRLCLNISTTRLILGDGSAGAMVEAFGSFVVGGNLAVGLIVFCVLTFVQFLVVAKGSERVAEVAARFTLDAMPGKQMSIDADVRAGHYDAQTARIKRQELQTESRFYGALDGAMKFVKGDAIAGIVIVLINIVGGFLIGMLSHGLSFSESLHRYTLLTVGDGLASQIPSLLNSLAAGLVVTRVVRGDGDSLSSELWQQLMQSRAVLIFVGLCAALLALIPTMPTLPLVCIGAALIGGGCVRKTSTKSISETPAPIFSPRPHATLLLSIGSRVGITDETLRISIEGARQMIYEESGLLINRPVIERSDRFGEMQCCCLFRGVPVTSFSAEAGDVDVIGASFAHSVRARKIELLDDSHTRRLLDFYEGEAPELVSNVVPHVVTLTQLTEVLRALTKEEISIRAMDLILQSVSEAAPKVGTERALLEDVRIGLARIISGAVAHSIGKIRALYLDPVLDLSFAKSERERVPIDPHYLTAVVHGIRAHSQEIDAVVVSRGARRLLAECLDIHGVTVPVIAHEEVCADMSLIEVAVISLSEGERYGLVEKLAA